jgi:catechol 2,3-dioxygenase-like lactoylglutathione lyase family enzyme
MFNHVMVGSNDVGRSKAFYDSLLGVLGVRPAFVDRTAGGFTRLFYLHPDGVFCVAEPIDGNPATSANGGTIGFACRSAEQVREFHDVAVACGGTSIEEPPGLRDAIFGGPMHLAYVRDPDGNKLCGVFRLASDPG